MAEQKPTKSQRTKAQIEEAARRLFREHGYDQTTVRDIAAAASIDPAMIIRYFGSKEALFDLVAEPQLGIPDLSSIAPSEIGTILISRFLAIWEDGAGGGGLPILLRSAASNETAAARVRDIFSKQVVPMLAGIGNPATAPLRAGLISTQLLGLALTRYVLNIEPVVAADRDIIVKEIGATIHRYAMLS